MTYDDVVRYVRARPYGAVRARIRGRVGHLTTAAHWEPIKRASGHYKLRLVTGGSGTRRRRYSTLYERDIDNLELKVGARFEPAKEMSCC
jgi:hypothetical protein